MHTSKDVDPKTRSLASVLQGTPFPLRTSQGRRFVRVELSSPTRFRVLTCNRRRIKLSKKQHNGEILNLAESGMLLATDSAIPEQGFILLTLNLNGLVTLEGVLGKIKRVEPSGQGDSLVGLQFVPREELERHTSAEEIKSLPVTVSSFNQKLRQAIASYLRTAELAAR